MIEKIKDKITKKYNNNKSKIEELNYKIKICEKNTRLSKFYRFSFINMFALCVCPFISFFATATPFISIPTFYLGTFALHFISEKILNYKGKLEKFSSAFKNYEIKNEKCKFLLEKLNLEVDNNVNKKILDTIDNKKIDIDINKNNVSYVYERNKEKLDSFYETVNERNKDFIYTLNEKENYSFEKEKGIKKKESIYETVIYCISYPIAVFVGVTKGLLPFLVTENLVAGITLNVCEKLDEDDKFSNKNFKMRYFSSDGKDINPIIDNNLIEEAVENKIIVETTKIFKQEEKRRQEKKEISSVSYYNYNKRVNSKPKTLVKSLYRK